MMTPFLTQAIEYENELGKTLAKEGLTILMQAYPGYSWDVKVKGGVCFIRLLDPRLRGNWGMAMKLRMVHHDAAVFKREVQLKAGEFLERANLRRGLRDGTPLTSVEGVPERHIWRPTT